MKNFIVTFAAIILLSPIFYSCQKMSRNSALVLETSKQNFNLKSLSKKIGKDKSMCFKFPDELISFLSDAKNSEASPFAFLTLTLDCEESGSVRVSFIDDKKHSEGEKDFFLQKGKSQIALNIFSLSQKCFYGFCVDADVPLKIESAFVSSDENFSGAICFKNFLGDDEKFSVKIFQSENMSVQNKSKINLQFFADNLNGAKQSFSILPTPVTNETTLDYGAFTDKRIFSGKKNFAVLNDSRLIDAIVVEKQSAYENFYNAEDLIPIKTDTGTIATWSKDSWRISDYEIFSWELLPAVLIFDFSDYDTQDKYLKRLAFFVEKNGYTGKLWDDKTIEDIHGFNAHDYRSESLAEFFNEAERTNFPLNEKEKRLCKVLLKNKIISRTATGFVPENGAIISISQESPLYLRCSLLGHECYHGIYFTDKNFRAFVKNQFDSVDKNERAFMLSYFNVTPSLNYNMTDSYLIENEFMAYICQQSVANCAKYFSENLASRYYVNQKSPELCAYIKSTNAAGFVHAAKQFQNYLLENYGLAPGRIHLVSQTQD